MKNIIHLPPVRILIRLTVMFLVFLCIYNCNSKDSKTHNFFYSGKDTIDITISEDTIGVLVNNTILDSSGGGEKNSELIKNRVDSILTKLGYIPSGYLGDNENIRLYKSPHQNQSPTQREKEAQSLKNNNKPLITNAGYLARLKGPNNPILITDEIIIRFKNGTKDTLIKKLLEKYGLNIVRKSPFDSLQYTVSVTNNSPSDALVTSHRLKDETIIDLSQLNYIYAKKLHSVIPNDDFFDQQWTLLNSGGNGTDDADIDADLAWDFSSGLHNTTIAVIDFGFDVNHYDLLSNFSYNTAERAWNNIDDDGNGYVDDTIGWNFDDGNNNLSGIAHGTAVSGLIAAVGNNDTGIIGSCPKCGLLPIKSSSSVEAYQFAFQYAKARGAKIINCSWEINASDPPIVIAAISEAANSGITIVCSMSNSAGDYCASQPALRSIPGLILVSRSTSKDEFYNLAGSGDCMSCLTPAGPWSLPGSTVSILTTDVLGAGGYNNGMRDVLSCPPFADDDFTSCFTGTSTSAALTSGIAGLIQSSTNDVSPVQVKHLLQDCADKIQHSEAEYSYQTAKSLQQTHGYGRLNAYEAVKVASSNLAAGGRDGVDIFLRDNGLDWGNTEKPSSYSFEPTRGGSVHWWESQDIKIDAPDPSSNFTPPADSREFENFPDESPVANKTNRVYVRVHNRGFKPARTVQVKLYWVYGGLALPALWTNFPRDIVGHPVWHFLGNVTLNNLEYSGASVAYDDDDRSQIATFEFNAPMPDPSQRNHYCLVALIDSPEDPLPLSGVTMDDATKGFNNISHRNYSIRTSSEESSAANVLTIYNPYPFPAPTKISIINPKNIKIKINDLLVDTVFTLKSKEQKRFTINIDSSGTNSPGEITLVQEFISPGKKEKKILGGFTIYYGKQKMSPKK